MGYIRSLLAKFQEETGDFYNLEATPAEGTSYRLARLDQKRYTGINFADNALVAEGKAPFYTNSTHLPVNFSDDIFEVLDLQDDLQASYTGGTVLHGFIGEEISDTKVVANLVRQITSGYKLPYFTLTPTFSVCPEHGYLKGEEFECPHCGGKTEVYSRVVGYLRPVQRWNDGKQCEYSMRKTYRVPSALEESETTRHAGNVA